MAGTAIAASAGFHRQGRSKAPRPLTREQRRRIEDLVEHFLAMLDEADGDPDLEPSLGWSRTYATTTFDISSLTADLEEDFVDCSEAHSVRRLHGAPSP